MIGGTKTVRTIYFLVIFFMLGFSVSCKSDKVIYSKPPVEGKEVIIDARSLGDKSPEFFSITLNEKRVNFFVVKVNGSVESYLDACENCYQFKKGYIVEGFYVKCKYCGSTYPLDSLRTGLGSCHPMPLKGKLAGDKYYISLREIEKAGRFF